MKNIKLKIICFIVGFVVLPLSISCDDDRGYDDYDAGQTQLQPMSGEWFINITDEATGEVLVAHALHRTFDDNNGRLFISDRDYSDTTPPLSYFGWWLESRVDVNPQEMSFSGVNEENFADGSLVNITDGIIIKNGGQSRTGVITDSIFFRAEFDYDPGTVLVFSGHKRTGFVEDEF